MFYVIQENVFKEKHYDLLVELMDRHGFEHEIVKFIPFVHQIDFKTTRKDVFCFGAVAMAKTAKIYGWSPGSMLNDNHDFDVYAPKYGLENMLNGDGTIIKFTDPLPIDHAEFFARPTKDSKMFTGSVFTRKSWEDYTAGCDKNDTAQLIMMESDILIAPPKNIQQEVRCWIVGGKVVSASSYRIGRQVIYQNYDHEDFFVDFAQKMADIYQPAEAFVLDVCLSDDELKIVEVNNINSAGFYHCNMEKLIMALEDHFN